MLTKKLALKICENPSKTGYINFDELPCIIAKLTFAFLLFLPSSIPFKSAGIKEVTILDSFLAFLTISQRKNTMFIKAAICILSFIQLAPKSIPCFWPTFKDLQNEVSKPRSSKLNFSQQHATFVDWKSCDRFRRNLVHTCRDMSQHAVCCLVKFDRNK